jgi:hypothetical protein
MEHIYRVVINEVVQYFKRITVSAKSYQQIFVFVLPFTVIKPTIIPCGIKCRTNVSLCNTMFEWPMG